jgi:hypothetical protein
MQVKSGLSRDTFAKIPPVLIVEGGSVSWNPRLTRSWKGSELRGIKLGHPLVDDYLAFVGARARLNTWLAHAFDLKVFFTQIRKDPAEVTTSDVLSFIEAQRKPRRGETVVRLEDGEAGLSARTIKRRLATLSSLFSYLVARTSKWNAIRSLMGWRLAGLGARDDVCP